MEYTMEKTPLLLAGKKKHKHHVGKNVNVVGGSFITHKGISPMVLTEPFGDGKSHQQE